MWNPLLSLSRTGVLCPNAGAAASLEPTGRDRLRIRRRGAGRIQPRFCSRCWGALASDGGWIRAFGGPRSDSFVRFHWCSTSGHLRPVANRLNSRSTQHARIHQRRSTAAAEVRDFIVTHGSPTQHRTARQADFGRAVARDRPCAGPGGGRCSIRFGCVDDQPELLLKAARAAHPGRSLSIKPHPDVMSSNRKGRVALERCAGFADHIKRGSRW